jgi:hypothetical protein
VEMQHFKEVKVPFSLSLSDHKALPNCDVYYQI